MSISDRPVFDDRSVPLTTRRLGRYEITGRIAVGGMATVYLARLEATGGFAREFALKVVHPHLATEEGFRQRFYRESRLASRVRHENVVATIDAGEDKGYCFLVLELIDGTTLRQLMVHRERPFAAIEAAFIVAEVARGLYALHTATDGEGHPLEIVHRDLSPHNVMLDQSGRPVLIDLGLAKADQNPNMTQVGVMCGKLPYMSPEQARLEALDARSDVFALGTVLFELCTGHLPFGETHTTTTLERLQRCDTEEILAGLRKLSVPRWLSDIIVGCLRLDPADRFPTALDLADALTQELVRSGHSSAELKARLADVVREAMPEVGVVSPVEVTPPTVEGSTGRSLRWMGLGALVAVLAFGGLYAATNLLSTKGTKSSAEPSVFESASVVPERPPDQAAKPEIPPEPEEEIPPEPPPREEPPPEPAAETGEAVLDTGTDGEGTTGGDAPRRIRRKPKPKKDGPKLREDNPYAR
ncbi:MAG: serine/threonine protein kinase [Myxococcales bacterium]|nr:serine/threonine protein kinase [Myxococcales bacterium]MCB9713835.1 serine/threonine protein kinase [Myxococcales bacterium]